MYNRRGQLKQEFKRETRFTSKCPADDIINKITKAAKSLGFDVQTKELQVAGNNWAKGHYTERAGLIDSVMDVAFTSKNILAELIPATIVPSPVLLSRFKVQVDQLDFVSR
ncbi:unnamed protein product [Rhodiola kirilowii]